MADKKIEISVIHSGQNGSGNPSGSQAPTIPSGMTPAPPAGWQSQMMPTNGNPAPKTVKERQESLTWMDKRNTYELSYNNTLQARLNILQQMAKLPQQPALPNQPNQPKSPSQPSTFMGMGARGWTGAAGLALASEQIINAFNFRELKQAQLEAQSAASTKYWDVKGIGGDYSGSLFRDRIAQGNKIAPSKGGMIAGDIAGLAASVAGIIGGGLTMTGGGLASLTGLGAIAGIPMSTIGAGMVASGAIGLGKSAGNLLNYPESLQTRFAGSRLAAQQAEIDKDPDRKLAMQQMIQQGTTKGAYELGDTAKGLTNMGYGNVGFQGLGAISGFTDSGTAQKIFVRNIAEGTKRGMDATVNAKEMATLVNLLSAGQAASGVSTIRGAQSFNDSFLSRFADVSTTRGLEAGQAVNKFFSQTGSQSGGAYGAVQYSGFSKAGIKGSIGVLEQLAMMDPNEVNADDSRVIAAAKASGKTPEETANLIKGIKGGTVNSFNPQGRRFVGKTKSMLNLNERIDTMSPKLREVLQGAKYSEESIQSAGKEAAYNSAIASGTKVTNDEMALGMMHSFDNRFKTPDMMRTEKAQADDDFISDIFKQKHRSVKGETQEQLDKKIADAAAQQQSGGLEKANDAATRLAAALDQVTAKLATDKNVSTGAASGDYWKDHRGSVHVFDGRPGVKR